MNWIELHNNSVRNDCRVVNLKGFSLKFEFLVYFIKISFLMTKYFEFIYSSKWLFKNWLHFFQLILYIHTRLNTLAQITEDNHHNIKIIKSVLFILRVFKSHSNKMCTTKHLSSLAYSIFRTLIHVRSRRYHFFFLPQMLYNNL